MLSEALRPYLTVDNLAITEDLPENALAEPVIGGEALNGGPLELLLIFMFMLPPAPAEHVGWVLPSVLEAGRGPASTAAH